MVILGIDQSISKTAYCVLKDEDVLFKGLSKTGDINCKGKKFNSVKYFETDMERIHHICKFALSLIDQFNVDYVALEGLAFSAHGNATRTLSMLYGALVEQFLTYGIDPSKIIVISPTAVKHFARSWLPEDEQFKMEGKKKTLTKMDKKLMIKAVEYGLGASYLESYKGSGEMAGIDDIADATVIAHYAKEKITSGL